MLFLSRVTPKKGLPMLLQAIATPGIWRDDWLLVIAGPDEFDHVRTLESQAESLGISERIRFTGPLYGSSRRDALEAAELFVLPTHSEGNPMAVLEAMAVGVPILTTTGVPCPFIEEKGAGWRSAISTESIADHLSTALDASSEKLNAMGNAAKSHIQANCLWRAAAERLDDVYRWVLGRGTRPDCVSHH